MNQVKELKDIINYSQNIVFFGGAGVSTESNIPDFRSAGGLFSEKAKMTISPEDILSHSFFLDNPEEFYKFYKSYMVYKDALPNSAHTALSALEKEGKLKAVITQNIDGLHQKAGSVNVIELHGSVHRNYCMVCGKKFELNYVLDCKGVVPKCDGCGGLVRPDVVLYEEQLDTENINRAIKYISSAEALIVGGTSLVVYPAATLVQYLKNGKLILINKSKTAFDHMADVVINDSLGKVLEIVIE